MSGPVRDYRTIANNLGKAAGRDAKRIRELESQLAALQAENAKLAEERDAARALFEPCENCGRSGFIDSRTRCHVCKGYGYWVIEDARKVRAALAQAEGGGSDAV